MVGDVGEREVVAQERDEEHDRRDRGRPEGGEQRVPGRFGEPAANLQLAESSRTPVESLPCTVTSASAFSMFGTLPV